MSLAIPTNLANRKAIAQDVLELLQSLPSPAAYHIFDGRPAATTIRSDELPNVSNRIAACSIIYALVGRCGLGDPIAGFVGNESLGTAKLLHLIDHRPPKGDGTIHPKSMEMLAVYIRYLYADFDWIQRVTVPANVQMVDDLWDLRVTGDDFSCIRLADANHRPKSSRPMGG